MFHVHTREVVHGCYQIHADTEEEARNSLNTHPEKYTGDGCILYEAVECEIEKVESGDPNWGEGAS